MGNIKAGKNLHNETGHNSHHCGAAIGALNTLQLLHMGQFISAMLKKLVIRRSVAHASAAGSICQVRLVESTAVIRATTEIAAV